MLRCVVGSVCAVVGAVVCAGAVVGAIGATGGIVVCEWAGGVLVVGTGT